jgi:hypothetical protein
MALLWTVRAGVGKAALKKPGSTTIANGAPNVLIPEKPLLVSEQGLFWKTE